MAGWKSTARFSVLFSTISVRPANQTMQNPHTTCASATASILAELSSMDQPNHSFNAHSDLVAELSKRRADLGSRKEVRGYAS